MVKQGQENEFDQSIKMQKIQIVGLFIRCMLKPNEVRHSLNQKTKNHQCRKILKHFGMLPQID
jgi:hypothetical protein